ncbi:Protein of unknown function [Pyronema omphalodes CBS 100304]|uniref:Uncharacterized protein n=1 Tax=Pyronema omphalodes (strain CBS 100304) TaxID=1076935 RepID=U4LNB1_PYROM|nr:Protein of unknown function [Pyronema omphalodes CBS 100304]
MPIKRFLKMVQSPQAFDRHEQICHSMRVLQQRSSLYKTKKGLQQRWSQSHFSCPLSGLNRHLWTRFSRMSES